MVKYFLKEIQNNPFILLQEDYVCIILMAFHVLDPVIFSDYLPIKKI